jgi:hypothetical protein
MTVNVIYYTNPPINQNNFTWTDSVSTFISGQLAVAATSGVGVITKAVSAFGSGITGELIKQNLDIVFHSADGVTGTISSPDHKFADILVETALIGTASIALGVALEAYLGGISLLAVGALADQGITKIYNSYVSTPVDQLINSLNGQPYVSLALKDGQGNIVAGGLITGGLDANKEIAVAVQGLVQQSVIFTNSFPHITPGMTVELYNIQGVES